jgi:hypothetical protein
MKAVPPADWFGWDGGYHTIEGGGVTRRSFLGREGGLVGAEASEVSPKDEVEYTISMNRQVACFVDFCPFFVFCSLDIAINCSYTRGRLFTAWQEFVFRKSIISPNTLTKRLAVSRNKQ